MDSGYWADGSAPSNASRGGYDDSNQFDWELVGPFNGWPGTLHPLYAMTDEGNGLHTGTFSFATPGTYPFKFRKQGSWDTSIGADFGDPSENNEFTVATAGDTWRFELDLPHGRWRSFLVLPVGSSTAIPEPASLALVLMAMAMGLGRSRRK